MKQNFEIDALNPEEIGQLLALHEANLSHNIDEATAKSEGFVMFRYNADMIAQKMAMADQIIARADGQVIGYALATRQEVALHMPAFAPVFEVCAKIELLKGLKYYFCGQVCVDKNWRGQGVFDAIYAGHRARNQAQFDGLLTEIATDNPRSLAAHWRVGFETIYTYFDDFHQKEWQIVWWDWRKEK